MRALNKIQYCQLHGESSQSFKVGCNNPSCPVQPKVSAGDAHQKGGQEQARREAEELWNRSLSNPEEAALAAEVERLKSENLQLRINAARNTVEFWEQCVEAPSGSEFDENALRDARETLATLLAQQKQEG